MAYPSYVGCDLARSINRIRHPLYCPPYTRTELNSVQMTKDGTAQDTILVLDTLKKFADLMDKQAGSRFMNHVREFVSHGGTVIMLAHTNKHRDADGKLVFAGTSDVVDDIDCAYIIDVLEAGPLDQSKTVIFENFKSRGDVADKATYRYSTFKGQSCNALLESVEKVSDDEAQQAARHAEVSRDRKSVV